MRDEGLEDMGDAAGEMVKGDDRVMGLRSSDQRLGSNIL